MKYFIEVSLFIVLLVVAFSAYQAHENSLLDRATLVNEAKKCGMIDRSLGKQYNDDINKCRTEVFNKYGY